MQQPLQLTHSHSLKYRSELALAYCNSTLSFNLTGCQVKEEKEKLHFPNNLRQKYSTPQCKCGISVSAPNCACWRMLSLLLYPVALYRDKKEMLDLIHVSSTGQLSAPIFQTWVWFWSFSLSHIENDLKMILQKRFRQHTKLLFFRKQRNNYNSLLLCILCKLFLLLSQVSIEPKRSWTLQNSILCLCFSKVAPDMGGKHFRRTAGSCKGVIVWLNYILYIQADLALPVAHSHIVFALNWSMFNFHFTNFQIAFISPTTLHSF